MMMNKIKMKNIVNENRNDAAIKVFVNKIMNFVGDTEDYDQSTKNTIRKNITNELKQLILTITGQNID
jgi:hypothetical protein